MSKTITDNQFIPPPHSNIFFRRYRGLPGTRGLPKVQFGDGRVAAYPICRLGIGVARLCHRLVHLSNLKG